MRINLSSLGRALVAAAFLAGPFSAAAALAGGLYQEDVHADSFGNLVIYSPAGYKRIVVGQGYLAEALKAAQAEAGYAHRGYAYDRFPEYYDRGRFGTNSYDRGRFGQRCIGRGASVVICR